MYIKWILGGYDVTAKSRGKTYSRGQTVDELQVNFTSISEVMSSYQCKEVEKFLLRCTKEVTCVAERTGTNGDRKDFFVEIVIGKEDTGWVGRR